MSGDAATRPDIPPAWTAAALDAVIAHHKQRRDPIWNCPSSGEVAAIITALRPLIAAAERERDDSAAKELADLKRIHEREWRALWVMVRRAGGSVFIPEGQMSRVPSLASLGMALEPGGMRVNASEEL